MGLVLSFQEGTLILTGLQPPQTPPPRLLEPGWIWDHRVGAYRCPAIHYREVRRALDEEGPWENRVHEPLKVGWPAPKLPVLRPEQEEAQGAWWEAGGRGQVIMPTGTGKTEVALAIMARASRAALVVAPVRDLMYQWHRRILRGLGYDAGIVGDQTNDLKPVTVTTYESAYIHMGRLGDRFGLVVFDEEHHLPGASRREAALLCAAPLRLGLTATPERSDGRHADLNFLIGPVVYLQKIGQARGKTLAEFEVIRIPVALSKEEQWRYDMASACVRAFMAQRNKDRPGYNWEDLIEEVGEDSEARAAQQALRIKKAIEDRAEEKFRVLEDLFRLHLGERMLVFAGSNGMAMEISRRFLVPTLLAHSRKRERLAVLEGFAKGVFPVLVANRVLDEGVDVPEAKVAVVLGGLASTRQAQQRLGRILRPTGKARAVLYEVVCEETKEEERSRKRRRNDAYTGTRHRRL